MNDTTIAAGSLIAGLQPYIVAIIGAVVTAGVAYGLSMLNKWLGLKISDADAKQVDDYLTGLAQRAIAASETNLANAKIDVKSSIVATLVNEAIDNGPAVLTKLGLGPDDIAHKITAAIGALQANMTTVTVPAAPAAPAAAPAK